MYSSNIWVILFWLSLSSLSPGPLYVYILYIYWYIDTLVLYEVDILSFDRLTFHHFDLFTFNLPMTSSIQQVGCWMVYEVGTVGSNVDRFVEFVNSLRDQVDTFLILREELTQEVENLKETMKDIHKRKNSLRGVAEQFDVLSSDFQGIAQNNDLTNEVCKIVIVIGVHNVICNVSFARYKLLNCNRSQMYMRSNLCCLQQRCWRCSHKIFEDSSKIFCQIDMST